jgi:hypothetical protein
MVPDTFSNEQIDNVRLFLIKHLREKGRMVGDKRLGNVYLYYKDIANLLNMEIESESDGDRLGIVLYEASKVEFLKHQLLITALVISKEYRRPGAGFYILAEEVGLFQIPGRKADPDGALELAFWDKHVTELVRAYGKK